MQWKQCPGVGRPAMKSEPQGGKSMCPVCTKYLSTPIGQPVPRHDHVVIDSSEREKRV